MGWWAGGNKLTTQIAMTSIALHPLTTCGISRFPSCRGPFTQTLILCSRVSGTCTVTDCQSMEYYSKYQCSLTEPYSMHSALCIHDFPCFAVQHVRPPSDAHVFRESSRWRTPAPLARSRCIKARADNQHACTPACICRMDQAWSWPSPALLSPRLILARLFVAKPHLLAPYRRATLASTFVILAPRLLALFRGIGRGASRSNDTVLMECGCSVR